MSVIVTEAHLRTALYVIRSLGKRGIKVICVSEENNGFGVISKYCWRREDISSPKNDPANYLKKIRYLIDRYDVKVIIPIHEDSIFLFSRPDVKEKFKDVEVPIPSFSCLQTATDKGELIKIASSLNIPTPTTYYISNSTELKMVAEEISYPAIIKARIEAGISPGPNSRYKIVNNPIECIKWYKIFDKRQAQPIVQEVIKGYGCGFFALFDKESKLVASAGHKRIRERFPAGGSSTFCESYYHPKVQRYGSKLLSNLQWYGVAMVEFKIDDRDNEPKLMEINPRFWGTTPLAILSGVDFPYLLYKVAKNEQVTPISSYKTGVKLRFLCDDIQAFLTYFKMEERMVDKLKLASRFFLDLLNPFVKDGILSIDDLPPSIFYLKSGGIGLLSSLLTKLKEV